MVLVGALACVASCTGANRKSLAHLPSPTPSEAGVPDSLVVLYYSPDDCFSCNNVLGSWIELAGRSRVAVWLAFSKPLSGEQFDDVTRMRLAIRVGVANAADQHSNRPEDVAKEVLFVHGSAVDSALVGPEPKESPLLARILSRSRGA